VTKINAQLLKNPELSQWLWSW